MSLSGGITVAVLAVLNTVAVPAGSVTPEVMPQAQTVREYVEEYFADEPIMVAIASCESQFRQFSKDGSVLKNPTSSAVGAFQIMASIHEGRAEKLGLDIYSLQGNAAYARFLYDELGTKPWNASKHCWKHSDAHLASAN